MFRRRITLHNRRDEIEAAERELLDAVSNLRYDRTSCFAIRLAVEEALSNAFKHGNRNDPGKVVRFDFQVDDALVHIDIEDEGEGFDPDSVPDPTETENLEIPAGRGLVLMRAYMTNVNIHPPGNRVELLFERPIVKSA